MSNTAVLSSKCPLRTAMEARDLPAIVDSFSPDAVFHSPLTDRLVFEGREQIATLSEVILEVFDGFHYTDERVGAGGGFLVARARIGGKAIEMVDHFLTGPDGRIEDITVFFRPLPAAATALRVIGAGLARRKSGAKATLISLLSRPLGIMTQVGDGVGVGLIRWSL